MNDTLGRYQPYNTVFHRLDSRVKLVGLIIMMVAVFLPYGRTEAYADYANLLVYGGIFLILFVFTLLSRTSFITLFRSLKAVWLMVFFLLAINIFMPTKSGGEIAFTIGSRITVYYVTIINLAYIFLRLVLVLMMTDIFTSTTKPMEMTSALEWLFWPLKLIRVPVHKFAMAISLALRFIPTLMEETKRIMKAQASRGVDYQQGRFREKVKALISLIIPLFMTAFLTSGDLADAMEARGYDPDSRRTRYRTYHWGFCDTAATLLVLAFLSGMICLCIYRFDFTDIFPTAVLPRLAD